MRSRKENDDNGEVDSGATKNVDGLVSRPQTTTQQCLAVTYPSILIRQPRGIANLATVTGICRLRAHFKVTGKVAADDAVPQAVTQAGEFLNQ